MLKIEASHKPDARLRMPALARLRQRFTRDDDGVAAVEFAFIAPLMLTLLIGIVDISNAVSISWRLSQLNRTLADLSSQSRTMTTTERNNIFGASAATLSPYTGPAPVMVISSVVLNNTGVARVCWSASNVSGNELAAGSVMTLPNTDMAVPNTSYIVTSSRIVYTGVLSPNFTMNAQQLYFRPRAGVLGGPGNAEQVVTTTQGPC